ncbi:DUF4262 domain-containing protein [Microvirga tunisiensis]|uniref:DUF4262 domain-containing protein n=1 Tax=Microvirga tunisiensis TaxID=2108360 RepID=A0A5N7MQE3_9HYPH|nr:DUF4262 domain-containing protein [Microvirga tunisiensis]MPR26206.1 DUF4262 domain-containing protein [Microvirga tunisiensis]
MRERSRQNRAVNEILDDGDIAPNPPGLFDGLRESFNRGIRPRGTGPEDFMAGPFDDYIKKGKQIIQRHGWMVQAILPDKKQPSYSYTVGLSQAPTWHPEIFIVGFHPD